MQFKKFYLLISLGVLTITNAPILNASSRYSIINKAKEYKTSIAFTLAAAGSYLTWKYNDPITDFLLKRMLEISLRSNLASNLTDINTDAFSAKLNNYIINSDNRLQANNEMTERLNLMKKSNGFMFKCLRACAVFAATYGLTDKILS